MYPISKSKFFEEKIEYLASWHWITRQVILPLCIKVYAILNIKAYKTRKELRQFIGIVNYYRDMWFHRSELLARTHWPASHQARSILNGTHPINRPLIKLRNLLELRCGVLLFYPYFNKPVLFHLYTDASHHQSEAVIMHDKKSLAFFFLKAKYNP
jgi:hypothetical protein